MFNNHDSNCPSCEFKSGKPGNPVKQRDGTIQCLDCGNSWKEFGNSVSRFRDTIRAKNADPLATVELTGSDDGWGISDPSFGGETNSSRNSAPLLIAMACITGVLTLATTGTYLGLGMQGAGAKSGELYTQSVTYEEFARPGGLNAVKVAGKITNGKSEQALVGKVEIILRGPGGREITRWQHSTSIVALAPGEAVRFVSAIPIKSGQITSVEARPL